MDPTIIAGTIIAIAGVVVAAIPNIAEYKEKKKKIDAVEREKERQHELDMRQAAITQTLINTAQNYDFARDAISFDGQMTKQQIDEITDIAGDC